jgi:hypothetical protein
MRILGAIVQVTTCFLAPLVSNQLHRCVVGWAFVSHHNFGVSIALHDFSENFSAAALSRFFAT